MRATQGGLMQWGERRPYLVLSAFAVALCLLIGPWWYATPDAAAYLSIARRMAHGAPPHAFGKPQPSFPLGYPLLISPAFWFGERPFLAISIIHWLLAVTFMLGVYRWFRRVTPDGAVLLTSLVMANVSVWNMYRRTLSEVAFLPLLIWTVNLANDALAPRQARRGWRLVALAGCLLLLIATREAGLLAAVAVFVTGVTTSRASMTRRALAATGALAGTLGVALLFRHERLAAIANAMHAAFFNAPDGAIQTLLEMARRRIIEINQLTIPGMFNAYSDPPAWIDANLFAGAIVITLLGMGWLRLLRRNLDIFLVLGPLYFVVLTFWPYDSGTRYVLPLLPLITACGWEALAALGERRRTVIALALAANLIVTAGYWVLVDLPRARQCHDAWTEIDQIARTVAGTLDLHRVNSRAHAHDAEGDRHEVAVNAVVSCVQLGLEVALDRPVAAIDATAPPNDVGWVITPRAQTDVAGFISTEHDGTQQLWSRGTAPRS